MTDTCATCRFWDAYDGGDRPGEIGDCRRRAPTISDELLRRALPGPSCSQFDALEENLYVPSAFPVTHIASWCGEFAGAKGDWVC